MAKKKKQVDYIDTGYAWIIVLGCGWMNVFMSGLPKSRGLIFVELMELFGSGASLTSFTRTVGAIVSAFGGPLAGILAERFGNRPIVIIGGILFCASNIVISVSPTIGLVIVGYGINGLGLCCVYGPTLSMIPQYFQKRRSLGNGLASAGASLGFCAIPPLVSFLIEQYTVRGCLLIQGALGLNLIIAGALLRPTSFYTCKITKDDCKQVQNQANVIEPNYKPVSKQTLEVGCEYKQVKCDIQGESDEFASRNSCESQPFLYENELTDHTGNNGNSPSHLSGEIGRNKYLDEQQHIQNVCAVSRPRYNNKHKENAIECPSCMELNPSKPSHNSNLTKNGKTAISFQSFGAISVADLTMSMPNMFIAESTTTDNKEEDEPPKSVAAKRKCFNLTMFFQPAFLLLATLWCFGVVGYVNTVYLLPALALEKGLSKAEVSLLLSIIGGAELFARIGWGYVGDLGYISRRHLVQIFLLAAGCLCISLVHLQGFSYIVVFAVLFGVFGGSFNCFAVVLLADSVGNKNIPSAMGMMLAFGSISSAISTPIMGILQEATGSYCYGFYVLGGVYLLGALLPGVDDIRKKIISKAVVSEI